MYNGSRHKYLRIEAIPDRTCALLEIMESTVEWFYVKIQNKWANAESTFTTNLGKKQVYLINGLLFNQPIP